MGNALGRTRKAKVMKIDGETFKLKTPATANNVVKDYLGHILLDSQVVKNFGFRAKPLEPHQERRPKRRCLMRNTCKDTLKVELPDVSYPTQSLTFF